MPTTIYLRRAELVRFQSRKKKELPANFRPPIIRKMSRVYETLMLYGENRQRRRHRAVTHHSDSAWRDKLCRYPNSRLCKRFHVFLFVYALRNCVSPRHATWLSSDSELADKKTAVN